VWIILIIFVVLVLLYLVCNYFYNLAISPGKKTFLKRNSDLPETSSCDVRVEGREWLDRVRKIRCSIKSHDGLNIRAIFIPSDNPQQKMFVVIAHGYSSRGSHMGVYSKFFNQELGFNVLIPDNRGHGESEGNYIGFGWHDRLDYIRWTEYLINTYGNDIKVILFGISMGAATVLMTGGENPPDNVKAIISDCGYTSAWDILSFRLRRMYGLPPFPLMHFTSLMTYVKAGYFLSEASALKQVKKARLPILFIHGSKDTFVPFEMGMRLYEACPSEKKFYVVEDAGHIECIVKDYDNYCKTIKDFIGGLRLD